jgi:hypothetical protein
MRITQNFGKRQGYGNISHVAFIVHTMYKRRGGIKMDIFVEATVNDKGIQTISLRENGTNEMLNIEHINSHDLYEFIIKEVNKIL